MKTYPKLRAASRPAGTCLPLLTLLSLALVAPLLADNSTPRKDHALFVGATLQVEDGPAFFEIVGAKGNSVSLLADGKLHRIRRDAIRNVRIGMTLKLSDVVARIEKMTVTPTFVPSNADRWAAMRMQVLFSDLKFDAGSAVTAAANNMATAGANLAVGIGNAVHAGVQPSVGQPGQDMAATSNAFSSASRSSISMQASSDSFGRRAEHTGDDALDIACELSTPRATPNTYALVLTEYREATGGKSSYNIHVEPIGELGPKPRKVTLTQVGFPSGFILGKVSLHLYSDSFELATNLSEDRVDLTADDALRYLVVCYVASHTKESLAATPLRIALPADFKQQAPVADLDRTLYATVGDDGLVQGLSAAPDHPVAVDPYIDSTVRKFRYHPALKEGKPVESVVEVRLAGLLR
jgi:hypothetical protein